MLTRYIEKALEKAHYELIDDEEPYYGEIPGLEGVWASGKTLEGCRTQLAEAVEDWVFFRIAKGLPLPPIDGVEIKPPQAVEN